MLLHLALVLIGAIGWAQAGPSGCNFAFYGYTEAPSFENITNCIDMSVAGNPISIDLSNKILFANGQRVRTLDWSRAELSDIGTMFALPPTETWRVRPWGVLEELSLAGNSLTGLLSGSFNITPALQTLWLQENQLTAIDSGAFAALERLRFIHLRGNPLEQIRVGAFAGLLALRTLMLNHNSLSWINPDALSPLNVLESLNLRDNHLSYLRPGAFTGLFNIINLNLEDNPGVHGCPHVNITRALGFSDECFTFRPLSGLGMSNLQNVPSFCLVQPPNSQTACP